MPPAAAKRGRPVSAAGVDAKSLLALRTAVERLSVAATKPVCRDDQLQAVLAFLNHPKPEPPMLQLFGMPGTGKTAVVRHAMTLLHRPASTLMLNGYLLQRPQELYQRLFAHLTARRMASEASVPAQPEQAASSLEWRFRNGWGTKAETAEECVIVIDEVDRCCENSGKVLFRLVDWLTLPHAGCKLITIANAMQLPERLEPKTRSRMNTTRRVTFQPYTADELGQIVLMRLKDVTPKVFSDVALSAMCKQIASHNGDGRRLLQTAAAAVHNLLCKGEAMDLGAARTGLLEVRHVAPLVRKVLQDRFVEYIEAQHALWPLVLVATIVREAIAVESRGASVSDASVPLPLVCNLAPAAFAVCAGKAKLDAAIAKGLTPYDLRSTIVTLQHVRFIELETKDGDRLFEEELSGVDVDDCKVVPLQSVHQVKEKLEVHHTYGAVLSAWFAASGK